MFEFTTQTIINNVADEKVIFSDTELTKHPGQLRIGNILFKKEDVKSIRKQSYLAENLTKVEFDFGNTEGKEFKTAVQEAIGSDETVKGMYRIALYLGLSMNSQDSFYANDFVYKGKPLYVEFPIKSAETVTETEVKNIEKIAKNYMLFTAQENILNITADGTKLTIEGVNGYQQIKKAVLQKYDPNAVQIDCCSNDGDYVDVITGVPMKYTVAYTSNEGGKVTSSDTKVAGRDEKLSVPTETAIVAGVEEFGGYNWIIHNLRLPTDANTDFWAPTKVEMPVVGGKYSQYIITICKERDGIAGEVVGQRATSVTNHVFWVPVTSESVFETKLANILEEEGTIEKDANNEDPFKDN